MPLQQRNASMVELLTPDFYRREVWHTWTPVITQGAVVTWVETTPGYNNYLVLGDLTFLNLSVRITSAGTPGNEVHIAGYPAFIEPALGVGNGLGNAIWQRGAGGNPRYHLGVNFEVPTYVVFTGYNTVDEFGIDPAITLANNDYLFFFLPYRRLT